MPEGNEETSNKDTECYRADDGFYQCMSKRQHRILSARRMFENKRVKSPSWYTWWYITVCQWKSKDWLENKFVQDVKRWTLYHINHPEDVVKTLTVLVGRLGMRENRWDTLPTGEENSPGAQFRVAKTEIKPKEIIKEEWKNTKYDSRCKGNIRGMVTLRIYYQGSSMNNVMIRFKVAWGLLWILVLCCDCKSIAYHAGSRQRSIQYFVGVVLAFEKKDKVEENLKSVLRHAMPWEDELSMI